MSSKEKLDQFFVDTKNQCKEIMVSANKRCQKIWDELRNNRSKIVSITLAMSKARNQCADIQKEARDACVRVNDENRRQQLSLALSLNQLNY